MKKLINFYSVVSLLLFINQYLFAQKSSANDNSRWTESFNIEQCTFSTTGENTYFILKPGYQLVLEGIEENDTTKLVISVLNETKTIGKIESRVVEERESVNGNLIEISRNYFAICTQTNAVFYFGEDVDFYKDGKVTKHDGSWWADSNGARAGVMMPGSIFLGARYYQEIAPQVAMDRAEIISMSERIKTSAGNFTNCLNIEETTPLEPKSKEYKVHAPGIGLVKDGNLILTKFGYPQ